MSKITVKEIKPAVDDKHPTVITDDTGAVMSGFDTALKDVHPGDILDVELKPKGKYLNIVSFKVLEKAAVSASPGTETSPAREYTRRIEMEIDARYRTTALECATRFIAGENATEKTVLGAADEFYHWLRQGAGVPGYIGFAIGRTIWWDPLMGYVKGTLPREDASKQIAANYRHHIDVYQKAAG